MTPAEARRMGGGSATGTTRDHAWTWLAPGLTVLVTILVFRSSLGHQFLSWDDLRMFPENPHYRGLGWSELRWDWTTFHLGEYMPLTWMTYGADYLLWGLDPFGYHLTNLALHGLTVGVVYVLGARLLALAWTAPVQPTPRARALAMGIAALLFAIHPLRVEPVAWVSARGSLLGGLLALLAVAAYLRAHMRGCPPRPHPGWWLASLGLFLLALLARSTNVMLPFVLLVLDVYPLGRVGGDRAWWRGEVWRLSREKLPFLALSGAFVLAAVRARTESEGVFGRTPTDGHQRRCVRGGVRFRSVRDPDALALGGSRLH
jgi:protein O-mannosyl-transferase